MGCALSLLLLKILFTVKELNDLGGERIVTLYVITAQKDLSSLVWSLCLVFKTLRNSLLIVIFNSSSIYVIKGGIDNEHDDEHK